ncbi:MAG TPA: SPOR domain-containing protein [Steroidobacteraceae bacterium]
METRVKERLVGAVILVALIVALVPEILSGPRRATTAGGSVDAEQPLRRYTIDLQEQGFPPDRSESEPQEPPEEAASPATPESSAPTRTEVAVSATPDSTRTASRPPTAREPAGETGWAVQLGSFSNAENAERLAAELRKRGYKAFVSRFESVGQPRSRVRVGPEQERARAEQLAERLRREGRQATVVAHP